jgi:hypothetical protein
MNPHEPNDTAIRLVCKENRCRSGRDPCPCPWACEVYEEEDTALDNIIDWLLTAIVIGMLVLLGLVSWTVLG